MIPNIFVEIFELNGLLYVASTALIAGVVRGFSGFGTAMIFLPVAGKYFDPVTAIIVLTIMDLCGSFNSAESLAGCLQTRFVAANWWHDNYTSARTVLFS